MAQSALKKSVDKPSKAAKVQKKQCPKKAAPKKMAPRKQKAIRDAKLAKKHTASLATATERLIASKVGHLEVIKGTRRELEQEKKAAAESKSNK